VRSLEVGLVLQARDADRLAQAEPGEAGSGDVLGGHDDWDGLSGAEGEQRGDERTRRRYQRKRPLSGKGLSGCLRKVILAEVGAVQGRVVSGCP
jgi:hypothetical protein